MHFAERFIRRPVLASMVSLGLVLVGAIGYTRLPVREFPDADAPVVSVTTILPGANPQVMAFSEVYQALQTGVVDGTENPHSNLYTQKMHEVQKYVTVTDHGYLGYAVIVNKKFWDGLPADIRTTLEGAMAEATKYANDIAKKKNDEDLAAVKASGKSQIITLTPPERAAWKNTLVKVHDEQADRIGADLIQEVYQATGFKK